MVNEPGGSGQLSELAAMSAAGTKEHLDSATAKKYLGHTNSIYNVLLTMIPLELFFLYAPDLVMRYIGLPNFYSSLIMLILSIAIIIFTIAAVIVDASKEMSLETAFTKEVKGEVSEAILRQLYVRKLVREMTSLVAAFLMSIVSFAFATYYWGRLDGDILLWQRASLIDAALFTLDLVAKGAVIDVFSHLHWSVSSVQLNVRYSNAGFCLFSLLFRLYITFVAIKSLLSFYAAYRKARARLP